MHACWIIIIRVRSPSHSDIDSFLFFFSIHSRPFKNKLKPMDSLDHTSSFYNNIYIIYPSTNRERWFDDQKLTW